MAATCVRGQWIELVSDHLLLLNGRYYSLEPCKPIMHCEICYEPAVVRVRNTLEARYEPEVEFLCERCLRR